MKENQNHTQLHLPGFVDLQVNGYGGVDFSSPELTFDTFLSACRELIARGTIAFLPTLITSSEPVYRQNLKIISKAMELKEFAACILGVHLEGPFISSLDGARGGHAREWIRTPDVRFVQQLIDWSDGKIKLITIAADIEGAAEICKYCVSKGIVVSLGHHLARENELEKLADSGASALTHLGNALPLSIPRHQNPIWAGLANDDLKAMIIADGFHLSASLLKTIIRTKGIRNVIVVSDSAPVAGLSPGKYYALNNEIILEESGHLYNPNTGFKVGSSANMLDCANYLASLKFIKPGEIIELTFTNPLRMIGIDAKTIKRDRNVKFNELENKFYYERH